MKLHHRKVSVTVENALRKLQFTIHQKRVGLKAFLSFFLPFNFGIFSFQLFFFFIFFLGFILPSVNINYTFHKFTKIPSLRGVFLSFFSGNEGRRFNEVFIKIRSGRRKNEWWDCPRVSIATWSFRFLLFNFLTISNVTVLLDLPTRLLKLFFHCFLLT